MSVKGPEKIAVKDIFTWLFETHQTQLPESALAKAIAYTLKLQIGLSLFVNDTSVPLSNNEAERTLRHAVMGRKNFEGSKTINGADTAATFFYVYKTEMYSIFLPLPFKLTQIVHQNLLFFPERERLQIL